MDKLRPREVKTYLMSQRGRTESSEASVVHWVLTHEVWCHGRVSVGQSLSQVPNFAVWSLFRVLPFREVAAE